MYLFEDCTICGEDIERLCVEKTVFRNVVFIDVSFRHIELTDVIFEKCDLSNADFSGAVIHRTSVKQSKMVGMNLAESTRGMFHSRNATDISVHFRTQI